MNIPTTGTYFEAIILYTQTMLQLSGSKTVVCFVICVVKHSVWIRSEFNYCYSFKYNKYYVSIFIKPIQVANCLWGL